MTACCCLSQSRQARSGSFRNHKNRRKTGRSEDVRIFQATCLGRFWVCVSVRVVVRNQSTLLTSTGLRLRPLRDSVDPPNQPAFVYEVVGLPAGLEGVIATTDGSHSWKLLRIGDDGAAWTEGFQTPEAALLFLYEHLSRRPAIWSRDQLPADALDLVANTAF